MATKAYRFALGSPDAPRSGVWRVWTHEDEVRAAVRTTNEEVTLTAYPTGRWRITQGTVVSKWHRPREFRPGWVQGPTIVVPFSSVPIRSLGSDPYPGEPVSWLPAPQLDHTARITLLFAGPRAEQSRWRPSDLPGTRHLTILPLRTLGALHIDRIDEPIQAEDQESEQVGDDGLRGLRVIISADPAGQPSLRESPGI
jgi:hypothetical protein